MTSAPPFPDHVPAEVVSIPVDGGALDGLLYRSARRPPRGVALLLHGNTMNFYVGAPRFLPPRLVPIGLDCLAFNRRGHDILSTRDSRRPVGGAFQTAAEGVADNEAAAAYVARLGLGPPVVVGHSNGGMLAAQFAAAHPETRALVLLSAHLGGPDIVPVSCRAGQLAADQLDSVTQRARQAVGAGRGDELMLLPGWWYVISAASFLDRLEATPSLLDAAPRIRCPVLFVVGDQEDPAVYPAAAFVAALPDGGDAVVVDDCDHFYRGRETAVAAVVSEWLDGVLAGEGALPHRTKGTP